MVYNADVSTLSNPFQPIVEGASNPAPSFGRTDKVEKVLNRYNSLKAMKAPWLYTYQLLGEFIMTRKQDFTMSVPPGQFLTGKIFDSTAPMSNHKMAAGLLGALWPNGSRSFAIKPSKQMDAAQARSKEVVEWFEYVTECMCNYMDDPKAGLQLALTEYMYDQGAFGISGIHVKDNVEKAMSLSIAPPETPVQFVAVDAKKITIAEGADGFVDTCYIEQMMTVRQVVQEYGLENCSQKLQEAFVKGNRQEEQCRILHAIEPRIDGQISGAFGNKALPIASIHIEVDSKHQLLESGYEKIPVFVTRFWKTMNEVYGRSPAMECMPDVIEVNQMREDSIIAVEKHLNPPLLALSDGSLGGQTINTSAGAISVWNISGRIANSGHKPVEPLITVGELKDTYAEIERLQNIIKGNFFEDLLTDLNNEQRQTLGEAQIRNQLRGQLLGPIFVRQIAECFSRLIERTFDILYKHKFFGYMPGDQEAQQKQQAGKTVRFIPAAVAEIIKNGDDAYHIRYVSPAARIMRSEELAGLQQSLTAVSNLAAVVPDIMDNIDTDKAAELIIELTGAPHCILRSADEIAELRKQRAAVQQQQAAAASQEQQSVTLKHVGQAAAAGAKAGLPIQNLFGAMGGQQTT